MRHTHPPPVCPPGGQGMEGVQVACTEAGLHPSLCQRVQASQHSTTGTAGPQHMSLAWQCHPHIPRQCQPHVSGHQRAAPGAQCPGTTAQRAGGVVPGQGQVRSGLGEIERNKQLRGQIPREEITGGGSGRAPVRPQLPELPVASPHRGTTPGTGPSWAVSDFRTGLGSKGGKKCLFAWIFPTQTPTCRGRLQ